MSEKQVEMKRMTKKKDEEEEESGSEYTGSEYTDESGSEEKRTDSEDDDASSEEEEQKIEQKTEEESKENTMKNKKPVGLLIERPVGWTTKGVIPSRLGFRKTRGFLLTLNVLLAILSICAIQVICLYRGMCSNSDDPTVPDSIGLSIVPLALFGILLVCPLGFWSSQSRFSSKVWRYHLALSTIYVVILLAMIIVGAVEYLDMLEIRPCIVVDATSGANCTGWDELSTTQRNRFQNDESEFETEINKNGAAVGIFGCLGCFICIIDVLISSCLLCSGTDEILDDDGMDLPLTTMFSTGAATLGSGDFERRSHGDTTKED